MTCVTDTSRRRAAPALGTFERYLSLWVALCILAGIVLGRLLPGPFQFLGRMTVAEVNIPVAVLIWLMIVPMLLKVDFGALHRVAEQWRGIAVTVGINWLVKPFSMALLGWLFIGWLFRPLLPAGQIDSYIAGLIILAAAPCTAMVFVWSNLTDGEPNFTLSRLCHRWNRDVDPERLQLREHDTGDRPVAEIGIAITSPCANRNTFVSPYINCPTPIVATAGYNNLLISPSYGGAAPPAMAGLVGVVSMPAELPSDRATRREMGPADDPH
jgi:hypothetical protein